MERDTIITTIWVVCVLLALVYFMVRKREPFVKQEVRLKQEKQILIFNSGLTGLVILVHFRNGLTKPDVTEISYIPVLALLGICMGWWRYKRKLQKRRHLLMELSQYPLTYEDQMVKALAAHEMGEDDVAQEAHARAVELQPNEGGEK